MIYCALYFILSYALVAVLARVLASKSIIKADIRTWKQTFIIVIGLLLLPFLPYGVVRAQTYLFGNSLLPPTKLALAQSGLTGWTPVEDFKVLSITPCSGKVYVCTGINPGEADPYRAGFTIRFNKVDGHWKYNEPDVVWSEHGSADGNIFPPYPEIGK